MMMMMMEYIYIVYCYVCSDPGVQGLAPEKEGYVRLAPRKKTKKSISRTLCVTF